VGYRHVFALIACTNPTLGPQNQCVQITGPAGLDTSHVGGELIVGQRFKHVADHRLPFAPDRQHVIE
jgi:hypothetical protein